MKRVIRPNDISQNEILDEMGLNKMGEYRSQNKNLSSSIFDLLINFLMPFYSMPAFFCLEGY